MRTVFAAAALALAVASVDVARGGFATSPPSLGGAPAGELRDCRSRGEGPSPQQLPPQPGVRIGPLLFWPSIKSTTGTGRGSGAEWPFVQKVPVILPARTKLVLAIAPEARHLAAFQHRGRFVPAIRFEACRERTPAWAYDGTVGKYTGFPFAIGRMSRSACVPMEVWVESRTTPHRRLVPINRASC